MINILHPQTERNPNLLKSVAYLDTLILLWYQPPPFRLLVKLSRQYSKRLKFRPLYKRHDSRPVPWLMKIQQPTKSTLEELDNILSSRLWKQPPFMVHRVDVAIDFLCSTSYQAEQTTLFLQKHVVQKFRHRSHRSNRTETVTYSRSDSRARRNICIYGDRLSKVTGTPCAHLELRFRGSSAVKATGLDNLQILINGFDVMSMLEHQAKLTELDADELNRLIEKLTLNTIHKYAGKYPDEYLYSKVNGLIHKSLTTVADRPTTPCDSVVTTCNNASSQEIFDNIRFLRKCLKKIKWDTFTQSPAWHVFTDTETANRYATPYKEVVTTNYIDEIGLSITLTTKPELKPLDLPLD